MTAEKNYTEPTRTPDDEDGIQTSKTVVKPTDDGTFLEAVAIQRDRNLNIPPWRIILENLELIKPI